MVDKLDDSTLGFMRGAHQLDSEDSKYNQRIYHNNEQFNSLKIGSYGLDHRTLTKDHRNLIITGSWTTNGVSNTTNRTVGMPINSLVDIASKPSTSGEQIKIYSTSALDVAVTGTGARTLFVDGIGSDGYSLTEVVELNSTIGVTTVNSYARINGMYVKEVGSAGSNQGEIYATSTLDTTVAGRPTTTVYCAILFDTGFTGRGYNWSTFGLYTVPRNQLYWWVGGNSWYAATQNNKLTFYEIDTDNYCGSNERIDYFIGELTLTGVIHFQFPGTGAVKPLRDIHMVGRSSTGTLRGAMYWHHINENLIGTEFEDDPSLNITWNGTLPWEV